MNRRNESDIASIGREFGSEADVEHITGRKRKTLQKDRLTGRGFPFYRLRGQILYNLNEVRQMVRAGRVSGDDKGIPEALTSSVSGGVAA
jgi:hypothetical protein